MRLAQAAPVKALVRLPTQKSVLGVTGVKEMGRWADGMEESDTWVEGMEEAGAWVEMIEASEPKLAHPYPLPHYENFP